MNRVADARSGNARRGTKLYFVASALAMLCALARYTFMARLLGPEQLGLAAALILTGQFFDSIADSGGDRFMIQDAEGDAPPVQKLVQLSFVVRGILIATCLFVFAYPIALLFGVPSLANGFRVFAISPLVYGFFHLDMRRDQRNHDFRTEAIATLLAESCSLVATVVAASLTHSYTAVLYGIITRSLVIVIVTHKRAERRYEIAYVKEHAGRLVRFSVPLMVNGLLLFFGGQSDRILVSRNLGIADLGRYSAVLLLIYYPTSLLARNLGAMHLPRIAGGLYRKKEAELASQTILLCLLMAAGFAIVTPFAIPVLYGVKFQQPEIIIALIGILQVSRLTKQWPSTAALAIGRSDIVLAATVYRLIGYPLAIAGAYLYPGLLSIVSGLAAGEIIALVISLIQLNRAAGQNLFDNFPRILSFLVGCLLILAWVACPHSSPVMMAALAIFTAGFVFTLVVAERETFYAGFRLARKVVGVT